ncbi:MAG: hypothetical protein HY075_00270 [Deltaproteobacteria bacterium]|nr:hypothetical protein [Deltaproteobacteria bacterium]
MTKGFVAFLGLLAFTGLVGCARTVPNRVGIDPAANVAAPALAGSAFLVAPVSAPSPLSASVTPNDKARITILKTALEKEFLLQSTLTTYGAAPSFGGLRSRVVAFRERAGKVYLLEATQGHTVTNDLPITLLLAEFPILAEDDTQVTIDFNAGMSNIFVAGDWYAHDFEGPAHERSSKSAKVRFSYIESAALNDHNQLAIRQIAQLGGDESSQNNESVEVKYYLSPYLPAADFEPVRVTTPDVVGFFEVAPQLTSEGTTIIRAAHFHAKSQITYAVSANTPAEFKQAVKDGILYWNKVFGDERVKVVDAPAGVTAPDVNYNIVQWVPFDSAGFAFADAQMDPRSGETLHAQVYLTSAFAYLGKDRMRVALKRQPPQPATPQARYSLAGFERAHLCDYD